MKDMSYESLIPLINQKVKLVIFIGENKEACTELKDKY